MNTAQPQRTLQYLGSWKAICSAVECLENGDLKASPRNIEALQSAINRVRIIGPRKIEQQSRNDTTYGTQGDLENQSITPGHLTTPRPAAVLFKKPQATSAPQSQATSAEERKEARLSLSFFVCVSIFTGLVAVAVIGVSAHAGSHSPCGWEIYVYPLALGGFVFLCVISIFTWVGQHLKNAGLVVEGGKKERKGVWLLVLLQLWTIALVLGTLYSMLCIGAAWGYLEGLKVAAEITREDLDNMCAVASQVGKAQ